jgi:hypothetical protein
MTQMSHQSLKTSLIAFVQLTHLQDVTHGRFKKIAVGKPVPLLGFQLEYIVEEDVCVFSFDVAI